jgi:cell division protein FtsI/penicillin-binding protein 2
LPKLLEPLGNENKVVAYYAAFKLSYLPDRKTAARALPVLQAILNDEKDEELRDRAKIAIMRIEPGRLKVMDRQSQGLANKVLKIRIFAKDNRKEKVALTIPLALADLALKALSAEQKRTLKKEGHDLDEIMNQLTAKGMKIDIQEENEVIQIWVE